MEKGKERHIFPGSNTPIGFFSYYHYIMPQNEANHIYCLKGGPGVGKSTFMKSIGAKVQESGLMVEYLHCSSDPDSLDGIVIPDIRVAMVDGTAPHIVDPINPGAVDEIINLGEYWDLDGIKTNKEEIIKINCEVGKLFKRAYQYIGSSKLLIDDVVGVYNQATDQIGADVEAQTVIKHIFDDQAPLRQGKVRKQFATAITPKGVMQYIDTLLDDTYGVYMIKNNWSIGVHSLLNRIADAANIRGINIELYYCPMDPTEKIEHVIIPSLRVAFLTQSDLYSQPKGEYSEIDLKQYTDDKEVEKYKSSINFGIENSTKLLDEAILTLSKAKSLHDEMEEYYIPYMDFDREKLKLEEILARILQVRN